MSFNLQTLEPRDPAHLIFSYLDLHSLSQCAQVCKSWNEASSNNAVWKIVAKRLDPALEIPHFTNIKAFVRNANLQESDQKREQARNHVIVSKIISFIHQVPLGQQKELFCNVSITDFITEEQTVEPIIIRIWPIQNSLQFSSDSMQPNLSHTITNGSLFAAPEEYTPSHATCHAYRRSNMLAFKRHMFFYQIDAFQGSLVFPKLQHDKPDHGLEHKTDMEVAIGNAIIQKLEDLNRQKNVQDWAWIKRIGATTALCSCVFYGVLKALRAPRS